MNSARRFSAVIVFATVVSGASAFDAYVYLVSSQQHTYRVCSWDEGGPTGDEYYDDEGVLVMPPFVTPHWVCDDPVYTHTDTYQATVSGLNPECTYQISFGSDQDISTGQTSWSATKTIEREEEEAPTLNVTESCPPPPPPPPVPCSISLSGPAEVCADCEATYTLTESGDCQGPIKWYRDGVLLGEAGSSFTTAFGWGGFSVTISARSPSGETTQVTTTVIHKPTAPSSVGGWGQFDVQCPPIQAAMIASDHNTLGLTRGRVHQPIDISCVCGGDWELVAAMRVEVYEYYYDIRLTSDGISAVSGGEQQHVQTFSELASDLSTLYSLFSGATSRSNAESRRSLFETGRDALVQLMIADNEALDAPGGPHPTLGKDVVDHGWWSGP